MQRHKIVAPIILLILHVIDFALAAPVLERGVLEVRVDEGDVAKDVPLTTASQRRWNPSPDSVHWSERDLRLHDPRSPMDSGAPGSRPPVDLPAPPPEHDDLQFDMDLNDHGLPRPGQEVTDGPDSGSHSTGSLVHSSSYHPTDYPQPSQEAVDGLDSGPHSTVLPQLSQEATDGPDSGPHSTDPLTHSGSYDSTNHPWPLLENGDPEELGVPMSPSSYDSIPRLDDSMLHLHGNWKVVYRNPYSLLLPPTFSEPGSDWPRSPVRVAGAPASYPGNLRPPRPYPPSDPDGSRGTDSLPDLDHSTGEHTPPDLELSTSPGTLQQDSEGSEQLEHDLENALSELLRGGRLKRRIPRSRSVDAAQRELQDTFVSSEYVSAPTFPFQLPLVINVLTFSSFSSTIKGPDKILDALVATARDVASSPVVQARHRCVSQATPEAEGNQSPLVLLV